jgi:hypothetical protein
MASEARGAKTEEKFAECANDSWGWTWPCDTIGLDLCGIASMPRAMAKRDCVLCFF